MADNPITTPLPADLPTDWVYGQTIGPNGTDVGLPQQYGYNYLMQQVNAAQQAAEELGDGLAGLSGDNIPESAGSETSISTALSNKAEKISPQQYDLPLGQYVQEAGYSCYWKDQQGMVFVQFDILLQDGISNILPTISTLPEGFRPKDSAYGCAALSSGVAIGLSVSVYGEIRLEDVSSVNLIGQYLKGTLAFISS